MLKEVLEYLNVRQGDIVLDATLGGGGHAHALLERVSPGGRLLGIDADRDALTRAGERLRDFDGSFMLVRGNFRDVDTIAAREGVGHLDAALFDVGVSSYQLDNAARGFSIKADGPLDMRMDADGRIRARDIVNKYTEETLSDIIKMFGEERFHRRIAGAIVDARRQKPIETTAELAAVIHRAVGRRYERRGIDPATRTFQALRIAVNDELDALREGLQKAIGLLREGGRIAVISFHSLEDRIAKHLFRESAKNGIVRVITKKPVTPSQVEVVENLRARSAKLRVAERIAHREAEHL